MPTVAAVVVRTAAGGWLGAHVTAPAVRAWTAGSDRRLRVGRLSLRIHDTSRRDTPRIATLLLHGLLASSDVVGAAYDALADDGPTAHAGPARLRRSMDTSTDAWDAFDLPAHLDAPETAIEHLVPGAVPVRLGGHSIGGTDPPVVTKLFDLPVGDGDTATLGRDDVAVRDTRSPRPTTGVSATDCGSQFPDRATIGVTIAGTFAGAGTTD